MSFALDQAPQTGKENTKKKKSHLVMINHNQALGRTSKSKEMNQEQETKQS